MANSPKCTSRTTQVGSPSARAGEKADGKNALTGRLDASAYESFALAEDCASKTARQGGCGQVRTSAILHLHRRAGPKGGPAAAARWRAD